MKKHGNFECKKSTGKNTCQGYLFWLLKTGVVLRREEAYELHSIPFHGLAAVCAERLKVETGFVVARPGEYRVAILDARFDLFPDVLSELARVVAHVDARPYFE